MHGLHLTADLHECRCAPRWFVDAAALGLACRDAVAAAGLTPVGELFRAFPATDHGPGGVTATVLLAESHVCVHTWPELRAATLDVYVCNVGADQSPAAHALMDSLVSLFEPRRSDRHELRRGALTGMPDTAAAMPLAF